MRKSFEVFSKKELGSVRAYEDQKTNQVWFVLSDVRTCLELTKFKILSGNSR